MLVRSTPTPKKSKPLTLHPCQKEFQEQLAKVNNSIKPNAVNALLWKKLYGRH